MNNNNLEIYIHTPFCVKKCAYCDFLSFPADTNTQIQYVHALLNEIRFYGERMGDYQVSTIYIGGGTPSWLEPELLVAIMDQVYKSFRVREDAEVSIECNPGTVTTAKLEAYRRAGINRLSIGLQSANNEELKMLGRIHTYEQFLKTYELARNAGYTNINVDLMSGLPHQSAESFADTLQKVIRLKDDVYKMLKLTQLVLAKAGYDRYEISNYAKPGYECRHNIGYWTRENYLGLGLGAASLVDNVRYSNTRELHEYIEICHDITILPPEVFAPEEGMDAPERGWFGSNLHTEAAVVNRKAQMEEFMFLGLRMTEGISRNEFEANFGMPIEAAYVQVLPDLQAQKLIEKREGRVYLTDRGMDVANYVMAQFLL